MQNGHDDNAIHALHKQANKQLPSLSLIDAINTNNSAYQVFFQAWTEVNFAEFSKFFHADSVKDWLAISYSIVDTDHKINPNKPNNQSKLFNIASIRYIITDQPSDNTTNFAIKWAFGETPFGIILIATIKHYLCALTFVDTNRPVTSLAELQKRWPMATLEEDYQSLEPFLSLLKSNLRGNFTKPVDIILKGTKFQTTVWTTLLKIPEGTILTYKDLAKAIGNPKACRAVGTAIGENPISYLIPCHRIVQANGSIGNYHWGQERKRALLAMERSRVFT